MLDQLSDYIKKQKLFQPEERMLLAVSGGIDSVVLFHLFVRSGYSFAVAHCNFQLRGKESDKDDHFVQDLAEEAKIQFFSRSFETEAYSKMHGISIQMAARELRRTWFSELKQANNFDKIATAHHLNDSIETALFNLAKGTGIAGLMGIQPKKEDYVRPLLFSTRQMIEDYAALQQLKWREDRSNSSVKYSRNLIRHHVIPELKKINPNLEQTFAQTSEKIVGASAILGDVVNAKKSELLHRVKDLTVIDKLSLAAVGNTPILVYEMLEEFGFNYTQIKDMLQSLHGQTGKVFHSGTHQITIDRKQVFIEKRQSNVHSYWKIYKDESEKHIEGVQFHFEKLGAQNTSIKRDKQMAMLDLDKLRFPLSFRHWKHGDAFFPLGMQHKKKVSDFMIDEKIPVNLKKQMLLLLSGNDIVWLVGHRIDERYKITQYTKEIFRIYFEIQ